MFMVQYRLGPHDPEITEGVGDIEGEGVGDIEGEGVVWLAISMPQNLSDIYTSVTFTNVK